MQQKFHKFDPLLQKSFCFGYRGDYSILNRSICIHRRFMENMRMAENTRINIGSEQKMLQYTESIVNK